MSGHEQLGKEIDLAALGDATPLVVRSEVPAGLPYTSYKPALRRDFLCSCAYCTMSEAEAQAIRMTIDHYEPRRSRPDLENSYQNLMYSCDECNVRKGDRCPPDNARTEGYRFFRPDFDSRSEHFEKVGLRLEPKSRLGYYSIEALDLNRQSLRRLRELRQRLTDCAELAAEGVLALTRWPIDRLPPAIRGKAHKAIRDAVATEEAISRTIDELLLQFAKSPLIDDEADEPGHSKHRSSALKQIEGLHPGNWRAPRNTAQAKSR